MASARIKKLVANTKSLSPTGKLFGGDIRKQPKGSKGRKKSAALLKEVRRFTLKRI